MRTRRKPWQGKDGRLLPNEKLKEIAREWGSEAWEEFLEGTVDVPLEEALLDGPASACLSDSDKATYQDLLDQKETPQLERMFRDLMNRLTIRERAVLVRLFWHGQTQAVVASELKVARGSVRNYRNRALKKIGGMMVEYLSNSGVLDEAG